MHVLICSVIDDPFDPPGHGRFGGGHLFLFDLGQYLVRKNYQVTYLTRKNSVFKKAFETLGNNCSIIRMEIGPLKEIPPDEVAKLIAPLKVEFSKIVGRMKSTPNVIHTIYWISGIVALAYAKKNAINHIHSVLSLGRLKKREYSINKIGKLRDKHELKLFTEVEGLILVCPDELNSLIKLYPEVNINNCHIIPYGIDESIFFPRPESADYYFRWSTHRFQQGT